MLESNPGTAHYTIERVLVTAGDQNAANLVSSRLDRVLGIADLFAAAETKS